MILTIYIKLHKLHKPLRGDSFKSISIFSFVFLDTALIFGCSYLRRRSKDSSYLMSSDGIFGTPCPINYQEHVCLLQRNRYVCLRIDRSNLMGLGRFSLVIGCTRRDDI
jgi:hypothetical protein